MKATDHLHPDSNANTGSAKRNQKLNPNPLSAPPDELDRIIAEARADAASASHKRASSPCPSTDSARVRADEGYNPIQYEYERKGGFREWWRRQRFDGPHGAAAMLEAVGQGFTYALISILN